MRSTLTPTLPLLLTVSFILSLAQASPAVAKDDPKNLKCEVAIIGGGAGGVYTAYRLGAELGDKVCLFEKEDHLGGRIYDVARTPGGPVFGTGALRVMETQDVVFDLANELGITFEAAPWRDDLVSARGFFGSNSDELNVSAYPLVSDATTETDFYDMLRFGPERANVGNYPDFRSYVRKVAGEQGYHFLTDVFRFRGDFEATLSGRGYLEWLDEEWDVCCTPYYPVGGMSEFIKRMEASARAAGVRIYLADPARAIGSNSKRKAGRYSITTASHEVKADRLVIAVDANGFKHVSGSVAEAIKAQPEFKDIVGIKVVTVAQWWPTDWWTDVIPGKDIRRAWTTEHCLNALEIPIAAYAADQLVTRTVYDDDIRCATFWEETAKRGIPAVEGEIDRGLKYLFPTATIPAPLKTHVQVWPGGWYFLRGGSPFSNADIAAWAITPLPGEDVSLVGDSYNPQRSTWSDAAYKSANNTLNANYGLSLPASGSGKKSAPLGGRKHREHRDR